MKKALVLLVLGLMMGVVGWAQTFINFQTINGLNNSDNQLEFAETVELNNGNFAVVGTARLKDPSLSYKTFVGVYDTLGMLVNSWISDTTHDDPHGYSIALSSDGGFIIASIAESISRLNSDDYNVVKFDSIANPLWRKGYHEDSKHVIWGWKIKETFDGGYVIAGHNRVGGFATSAYVLKLDYNGDSLWSYTSNDSMSVFYDVISLQNGHYLAVGDIDYFSNSAYAVMIDSSGQEVWKKNYGSSYKTFKNIVNAPGNSFLIVADSTSSNERLVKINNTGQITANQYDLLRSSSLQPEYVINTHDGGIAITTRIIGVGNGTYLLKYDNQYKLQWYKRYFDNRVYPTSIEQNLKQTSDKGYLICGSLEYMGYILKTDSLGNIPYSIIDGHIYADVNGNCLKDSTEGGVPNQIVHLKMDLDFYGYTDSNGYFQIKAYDSGGDYILWQSSNRLWGTSTCSNSFQNINLNPGDSLTLDIYATPIEFCEDLVINVSTIGLRPCMQSTYYVSFSNNGTLPSDTPRIEIAIDSYLTVDSATIPWTSSIGNTYRWDLDTLGINESGNFKIYATLDCDSAILGQSHCVAAHIYPDSICSPPSTSWDSSSVLVSGICGTNGILDFTIENIGMNDMSSPSFFLIAEDNVMYTGGNIQLNSGEDTIIRIPSNGKTFTLIAQQVTGHPGLSNPMVSIEGCGTNNNGSISTGFLTQYPQDDQNLFIDILCVQSTSSYDPNDKRPEPLGLDNEGYITATQPLDYTIRFQNTGTDTAFTVVLRDTLSPYLDITTLYLTGASHPYTFQIIGSNVLEWTFANILLPDSNVNEPLSHGFVSFHIKQTNGNTPGTEITNRAGIYFDFNAVVLTNTTLNTIINDYKTWFTFIQSPESKLQLVIYPNPNNGTFSLDFNAKLNSTYEFAIYDLAGAKQFGQTLNGSAPYVLQPDLPTGMYIYQLLENNSAVGMGKVIVNK